MNIERWDEIKEKIKESFSILDDYDEDLDPGIAEVIEFEGPVGKLKARFVTRPKVMGKKTLYSNRVGGDIKVDYEFSDDETVCHFELYKWDDSNRNWVEMRGNSLF